MNTTVRIVIVSPDNIARVGIRTLLYRHKDFDLVGETSDYGEIHPLCQHLLPHILLVAASIPSAPLVECVDFLRHQAPPIFTLVLANTYDEVALHDLIQAGIAGYIM